MEAPGSDLHAAYYGFLCESDGMPPVAPLAAQDLEAAALAGASTSAGKGRKRTKQLQDEGDSDDPSDDDEETGRKSGKKGRAPGSDAAKNKASREKARREKINDRCEWLEAWQGLACERVATERPHAARVARRITPCPVHPPRPPARLCWSTHCGRGWPPHASRA